MKNNLLIFPIGFSLLLWTVGCNTFTAESEPAPNTNSAYSNSGTSNPASKLSNTASGSTAIPYSSGPLLGKWERKDSSTHTMEFKEDGTLTIEYAGRTINDKYSYISNNQITDTDSSGKTRTPNFSVKGDEMTLTWTDAVVETAKNQTFVRVKKQ